MARMRCLKNITCLLGVLCAFLLLAPVQARATIRYEVSLAQPSRHIFHVTMTVSDVHQTLVLQMPAWDALYQIRDFGYHVTDLHAADQASRPLRVERLDKQTWRIQADGVVRIEYATWWNEPGPFGTELTAEHAFLNLAMVLCYVPTRRAEPSQVRYMNMPDDWRIAVELPKAADAGGTAEYAAPSYDALVDAPVEISRFDEIDFRAAGRPIRAIVHGASVDHARLAQQLTSIIEYETSLMGDAPFPEYTFLFHIGRDYGGGGMEHPNSTAISVTNPGGLLNVSAHEFFHLWNVKRIRPQSLEPVDYTKEMVSPSLWFAEGVTNTYAAYTLVRTKLWTKTQFLSDLSEQINEFESRPAHRWQSAEESSRNAWLEKYSVYNQPEYSISYYNKGQLLGVGLDILIRDATNNRASLDDVMRGLNREYAQRGRFYSDSASIREVALEVLRDAGVNGRTEIDSFFERYVAGAEELPLAAWLARAGLNLSSRSQSGASLGFSMQRNSAGEPVVAGLDLQSAAARAGIREGDVVTALDGTETPRNVPRWLRGHQPGDTIRARIRRIDGQSDFTFVLSGLAAHDYSVEEISQPNERQRAILNGLLQGNPAGHVR